MGKNDSCTFFEVQNGLLKLIFVFFILFSILVSKLSYNFVIYIIFLLYLSPCPNLIFIWLKLTLRMLPLFIVLYIFVLITNIDFLKQTSLVLKIWFLLLISVYVTKTSKYFMQDFAFIFKYQLPNRIYRFFLMVFFYTKFLIFSFYKEKNFNGAINELLNKMDSYQINIIRREGKADFWIFPNVYLMFFLTIVFLVMEI